LIIIYGLLDQYPVQILAKQLSNQCKRDGNEQSNAQRDDQLKFLVHFVAEQVFLRIDFVCSGFPWSEVFITKTFLFK
jgi:hypothetical protein